MVLGQSWTQNSLEFAGVLGDDQIRVLEHLPCGPRECEGGGFCWDGGLFVREMIGEMPSRCFSTRKSIPSPVRQIFVLHFQSKHISI